ncbi:methyltransferase domain-containing protein [Megalodesulfovibrio paquesii]
MTQPEYHIIQRHYEQRLAEHGPNHRGVDWPNAQDLQTRFEVMLGVVRAGDEQASLLDLGCGVGLLRDHVQASPRYRALQYTGMDISEAMIHQAAARHPEASFRVQDILQTPLEEHCADYIVMNGVLTEKLSLSQEAMEEFAHRFLAAAFKGCRIGMAFNVMNHHVDWKRDDLFHWPLDNCAAFLVRQLSRHVAIRMDYGLYEYTVYVYKTPCTASRSAP